MARTMARTTVRQSHQRVAGWLVNIRCQGPCRRFFTADERGYQIHVVENGVVTKRRILVCAACFALPRTSAIVVEFANGS